MQLFFLLLIFILICSHVAMVTAVTGCTSDRDKDHRPRENCPAAGFSDVPAGLEPTTKVLLFPKNLFSSLSWSSFQSFTELYEIDLMANKIPAVTPTSDPVLPTLRVLRLGSNLLTSLPDHSFSACPGLTELYLDSNNIGSLSDHTFSGLSKLEILDLSSNQIKVLPMLMLHPLPAIETLYLEINKIKVMPDDWFSMKEEVLYLYLSANPWACSCSLGYLRRYLDDYESNVYVRDGPIVTPDGESVVCDSPPVHKGTPVLSLEESDLCSSSDPSDPGVAVPSDPGDAAPSDPGDAAPSDPGDAAPSDPGAASPTDPGVAPPTDPGVAPPFGPSVAPPSDPYTAPPSDPYTAPPDPGDGLPSDPSVAPPSDPTPVPPTPAPPTSAPPTPAPPTPAPPTSAPPTPAPPTPAPPTPAPPTPAPPTPASTDPTLYTDVAFLPHTVYHRVVTWSWIQTFTRFVEWSEAATRAPADPVVRSSGGRPATTTTAAPTTSLTTEPDDYDKVWIMGKGEDTLMITTEATATTTTPSWDEAADIQRGDRGSSAAEGVFCFWLFVACLLLCAVSAACSVLTLTRLIVWYRRVYRPLSVALANRGGGREGVMLLTYSRKEAEVAGGGGGGGGVMALYRSVLFIHREAEEGGGREGEGGGRGGKETPVITLEPVGAKKEVKGEDDGERGGREEREARGVYRKTLYRLLSKEEEIDGWRDVMEECRVSAEDGGMETQRSGEAGGGGRGGGGGGGGGEVSRKRYSVILREERSEEGGGREELDWVVGGWEVKRGEGAGGGEGEMGEEPRSSWGEWLAHYLPSMPWSVTMPPEGEAAQ